MELRQMFSRDILSDLSLAALCIFLLSEAQPKPSTVRVGNEFIDLKPYESLIDFAYVEGLLPMTREVIMDKLSILEKLRRVRVKTFKTYACVEFIDVTFPINPVVDKSDPSTGLIPATISEWKKIDFLHVRRNFSSKYLELVEIVLDEFEEVVGDKQLMEIDKSDYQEYVRSMQRRKISYTSINNYTRALKASIRRALTDGYLKDDPVKGIKPLPQTRKAPIVLQADEVKHLISFSPFQWFKSICQFNLLTGMRRGEIINLKWENIDFNFKTIEIRSSADFHPKFNKERTLPLTPPVEEILNKIKNYHTSKGIESEYVFVDDNGGRIRGDRVTKEFKSIVRAVGLREELHFHALRRTFATKLKSKNTDTNTIKGILGHASIKTTDLYLGTPSDEIAKAMGGLDISAFYPSA